jgi:hypothetical protein
MPQSAFSASTVPLGLVEDTTAGAPAAKSLTFAIQHQRQTNWCWAAVSATVSSFYRNPRWTQCRVVSDQLNQQSCCSNGSTGECNKPWYLDQALQRIGHLNDYASGALSWADLKQDIDAGRPIGVRIGWATGGGHFVAVAGYSDAGVINVQDPWYGQASVDYATFKTRYHGNGRWTHSYKTA